MGFTCESELSERTLLRFVEPRVRLRLRQNTLRILSAKLDNNLTRADWSYEVCWDVDSNDLQDGTGNRFVGYTACHKCANITATGWKRGGIFNDDLYMLAANILMILSVVFLKRMVIIVNLRLKWLQRFWVCAASCRLFEWRTYCRKWQINQRRICSVCPAPQTCIWNSICWRCRASKFALQLQAIMRSLPV